MLKQYGLELIGFLGQFSSRAVSLCAFISFQGTGGLTPVGEVADGVAAAGLLHLPT